LSFNAGKNRIPQKNMIMKANKEIIPKSSKPLDVSVHEGTLPYVKCPFSALFHFQTKRKVPKPLKTKASTLLS